jgi:hypothetical protein
VTSRFELGREGFQRRRRTEHKRRMSLPRGYEPRLHADVQLLCAPNREPDAAASGERGRLGELRKPEQLP